MKEIQPAVNGIFKSYSLCVYIVTGETQDCAEDSPFQYGWVISLLHSTASHSPPKYHMHYIHESFYLSWDETCIFLDKSPPVIMTYLENGHII